MMAATNSGKSAGALSRTRHKALLRVALALALAVPAASCSSFDALHLFGGGKYVTKILPQIPATDIYDQGLARLHNGDDKGAGKKFSELEKEYPYSEWSRKGLLMETYSQYQGGQYDDAVASAKRYVALYPSSHDAAYAYYLAGMSEYNSIPDISRDQQRANKAIQFFTDLITKYPKSEYVDDAKFKIGVARDQLAGKDLEIGRYYLRQRDYPAAINRFHDVLARYQTTRETEEALYRLTEAYLAMGVPSEAQTAAAVLGHNFPDSRWYKSAYSLLKGGGLQPREDHGSWISKIFRKVGLG